jgi:uncharacterized membrane protein
MRHASSRLDTLARTNISSFAVVVLLAGTCLAQGTFVSFDGPHAGTGSGQGTAAVAISPGGGVGLTTVDDSNVTRAYVRHPNGDYLQIAPPNAVATYISGVNASGQVAGTFIESNRTTLGYVRNTDGTYTILNPPGANGLLNLAGINDAGQVAGTANPGQPWMPFFWDPAQPDNYVTFGVNGGTFVLAAAINGSGQVAGDYSNSRSVTMGFVRSSDGTITTFNLLKSIAGGDLQVKAMNDKGTILCEFSDENNSSTDLLLRYSGGGQNWAVGPEEGGFVPAAINDPGTSVGLVYDGETSPATAFAMTRSFDNILIPIPADAQSSMATAVNNAGQIVGSYVDTSGVSHGWIYTP